MTKTLALDLATRLGFALGTRSGVIVSGSRQLPKTGDDLGTFGRAFRDWLVKGIKRHSPDLIVYEQPILRGVGTNINTLRKLYGLAFMVEVIAGDAELLALNHPIPVQEINNADWIKHFLGAGNVPRNSDARKKAVFRMCQIRGWRPGDYDEGDALAILDYAHASASPAHALEATPLFQRATAAEQLVPAGAAARQLKRKALVEAAKKKKKATA
jgi:crossover junction endodeoxyribonuclease RuvC